MDGLVITHSDISDFLMCRRRWYWNYVADFRKPEKRVGALALGTRVHAALEHYYKTGGDPAVKHDELFRADLTVLEDDPDTPTWDLEQLYKDVIIGRNCVSAHQEWLAEEGPDDPYTIEGVEQTVTAPILGGRVTIVGKVDVLFRRKDSGFLVINDLKTDGGRPGVREQLERSWQHHIYLIALRLSQPDEVIHEAHYTVIRKLARPSRAKGALVERFRVPGTTRMADTKLAQLEVICSEMLRVMADIETDGFKHAFPTPNHECRWCEFRQPCEVVDESVEAARAMLDREFTRGGRHGRYAAT
jgi:hypothetical protein